MSDTKRRKRRLPDLPPDLAPDYTEWINHRYDPGYYLGGRIPPYLKRRRGGAGNSYGWVLIVGAAMAFVFLIDAIHRRVGLEMILGTILASGVVLLQLFAGIKLIQGDPTRKRR